MAARIDQAEEKWRRNAMDAAQVWVNMVRRNETFEAYVNGISRFTGIAPETVRGSRPANHYREFQGRADAAVYRDGIDRAYAAHKWRAKYLAAFGGAP